MLGREQKEGLLGLAPNGAHYVRIPATVYPGVFDGEYQVTIQAGKKELSLNVSVDFVDVTKDVKPDGTAGYLRVEIVDKEGSNFLVTLPGEVQGASSRVRLTQEALVPA